MGAVGRLGRLLPATKGEVQDVNTEFKEYKNETTTVINALVSEINSLTPVGSLFWHPASLVLWQAMPLPGMYDNLSQ